MFDFRVFRLIKILNKIRFYILGITHNTYPLKFKRYRLMDKLCKELPLYCLYSGEKDRVG